MKRIVFVDDEPNVLDGLRRMLRSFRHEWSMEFAASGGEALALLAQAACDVLVTDMRMPGMDGAELLGEVRTRYPNVVRIVLSGQGDRDAVLRSVHVTHQYLAKPCDPQTLKATVLRACALRDLLAHPPLQALISRLQLIPSLPSLYAELERELASPEPSLPRLANIIAADAGMTAKTLQLVNSAFFGIHHSVSSPTQAVMLLGCDTIRALVLTARVFACLEGRGYRTMPVESLWKHSQLVSGVARRIAQQETEERAVVDEAGTAGLLHDAGKLLLAAHLSDAYGAAIAAAEQSGRALWETEQELLGATHAEVAAYLFELWGLPVRIVEAVAWHHRPSDCPNAGFSALTAVYAANTVVHEVAGEGGAAARGDAAYLDRLGLSDRLPAWRRFVPEAA
jgi:HD-like signal output (HDOD) protein